MNTNNLELVKELALWIQANIQQEFADVHLSKNLMNTITIEKTDKGYRLTIPAQKYDIDKYRKEKVIIYTGKGSYADEVDIVGGFSRKHKGYVDESIDLAIALWQHQVKNKWQQ